MPAFSFSFTILFIFQLYVYFLFSSLFASFLPLSPTVGFFVVINDQGRYWTISFSFPKP